MSKGTIKKVAGPLVIAQGMRDANMFDVCRVSGQRLIGEIIEIHGDEASVQVYEETSGLGPGEPVESTGAPLSVELGPGLIGSIFDGIQRPLETIMEVSGNNLQRGIEVPSLSREKVWHFVPSVKEGDSVTGGDIIGSVQETKIVSHKIMAPNGVSGKVKSIQEGDFNITQTVAVIENENGGETALTLMQSWPVRKGRPYKEKLPPDMPLRHIFQGKGDGNRSLLAGVHNIGLAKVNQIDRGFFNAAIIVGGRVVKLHHILTGNRAGIFYIDCYSDIGSIILEISNGLLKSGIAQSVAPAELMTTIT